MFNISRIFNIILREQISVCLKSQYRNKLQDMRFLLKFPRKSLKLFSISLILLSNGKDNNSITDEEFSKNIEEFESKLIKIDNDKSYGLTKTDFSKDLNKFGLGWEKIMDTAELKLWRRKYPENEETFEYRACGTYKDVSAKAFMLTQTDLAYRKQWDNLVILLNVIFKDDRDATETIRWVSYYPYPLANREYIFLRRILIDEVNGRAVIMSRAIAGHPEVNKILASDNKIVRVTEYVSKLFVQAHSNYDKPGMDYFLIYYDNPKAEIPSIAVKWVSSSGIPSFINKLHNAALKKEKDK